MNLSRLFGTFKEWLDEPAGIPDSSSAPVDVLVIDHSGSMSCADYPPTRLDGAKRAGCRFLERRAATDTRAYVGIVTFSRFSTLVAHAMPVKANLMKLKEALGSISISGATNISAGLERAYQETKRFEKSRDRRIVLLTDGHTTNGFDPVEAACEIKSAGVQLDIIGIGGSPAEVNESALREMASIVNGERRYWFIKSVGELVQRFETLALREIK